MKVFFFITILAFSIIGFFAWYGQDDRADEVVSPVVTEVIHEAQGAIANVLRFAQSGNDDLESITQHLISNSPYDYGIVIQNLKTGKTYMHQQDTVFPTASLYKLWVMAAVFDQITKGTLRETDTLSEDVAVLNEAFGIATESAERTEGTITMTVGEALRKMITVSDNYAALLLSERIRNSTIQRFLTDHGLTSSKLGQPPTSTAGDIALFFEKLYRQELADTESTNRMIALLKEQKLNNKIPRNLPDDAVIAHKTGELGSVTHDAGILYTKNGNAYILVILSQGDNKNAQEAAIAAYAKSIYDYILSH